MSKKKYCFSIINPENKDFDINELIDVVKKLYIKKDDDESKLSFITFYSKTNNSVCIQMKGVGKTLIENIEKRNYELTVKDLKWKDGISLSEPYEPDETQVLSLDGTPGKKWDSITQYGPYFTEIMEPYKILGATLSVRGNKLKLSPTEEKIAGFYAKRIIAEIKDKNTITFTRVSKTEKPEYKEKRDLFNTNFWEDFKTYLSSNAKKILKTKQDFLDIDWTDLINLINKQTEANKILSKDAKAKKTAEKIAAYGYASINGKHLQKLANFSVEPSGIFTGIGNNKLVGKIKKQVFPENVTLNLGKTDPIPLAPSGYNWGSIVHEHNLEWLARWKDNLTNKYKYIWFSQEGVYKAQSDLKKYEKARKLHDNIESIRKKYMNDANSTDTVNKQLGTVLYLIDHFGIRVGNEKDEDEADTVGATTLEVENVNLQTPGHVIFDFLGKDSIRFYKDLKVDPVIFKNFQDLVKKKSKKTQIFDQINSTVVNNYLKDIDKHFTAKVFRTRLASETMYYALQVLEIPKKSTNKVIKMKFVDANKEVAEILNHVRTPSLTALDLIKKLKVQLGEEKDSKKIQKLKENIESKENVLSIAINTSLANYIDPRLVVSWSKSQNVPLSAIYPKALLSKFKWAINKTEDDWSWEDSPLEDIEEEEEDDKDTKTKKSRQPKSVNKDEKPKISSKPPPKTSLVSKLPPKTSIESSKPPPKTPLVSKLPPKISIVELESSKPKSIVDLNEEESYKLLLQICNDLKSDKLDRLIISKDNISKIRFQVLEWVYPYSQSFIKKRINVEVNKYIVDYFENNVLDINMSDTDSITPEIIIPEVTTYIIPTTVKTKPKTLTPTTPPRKKQDLFIPRGTTFSYLNTYNEADLRKYCKKYNIQGYDKKELKEAVIELFKDTPWHKIPI